MQIKAELEIVLAQIKKGCGGGGGRDKEKEECEEI